MTYFQPFLKCVFSGTLYSTETWSFGVNLISVPGPTPNVPDTVPSAILDAIVGYIQSPQVCTTAAALTQVKVNLIGTDGKYVNEETVLYEYDVPVPGTVQPIFPAQVALAVSLRTEATRGRAHAGRYYFPAPAGQVQADGGISQSNQDTQLVAAQTFLQAMNASMSALWHVGVVSNLGTGGQREVTTVRVGRALDTMRSRRRSIEENYAEVAV
jgi:hypothetical protein